MTSFDDRQKGQENRFAHDAELEFKATARRNKLLGLWAAGLISLSGDEAEAYAKSVVIADLEEAGDNDVIRKILADLAAAGVAVSESQVKEELARLLPVARDEVARDVKK